MKIVYSGIFLLTCHSLYAAIPIDGWYANAFGGYAYLPNNLNKTIDTTTRTDATYRSGFNAGASCGYKSNPMRYEGEISYINADLKNFKINQIGQTQISGYTSNVLAMANIFFDFPAAFSFEPFLGGGIGYGWVKGKFNSEGPLLPTRYTGSNSVFAYQGIAGLTYNFAENYALDIGYRYVGTERVNAFNKSFQAHMANVAATYRFDGVSYK